MRSVKDGKDVGGGHSSSASPKERRHTAPANQGSPGGKGSRDEQTKIPERRRGARAKGERDRTLIVRPIRANVGERKCYNCHPRHTPLLASLNHTAGIDTALRGFLCLSL